MRLSILLLLMPAWAFASISFEIKSSASKDQTTANFKGSDIKVISDEERLSFNLTTPVLKAAVKKYVGGTPLDVFVKSPTPWGDLYKTYNWSEVIRNTEVKGVNVVAVKTEKVTLAKQYFSNKLAKGLAHYTADMKANVVNYVTSTFSGKEASVDVKYNVQVLVGSNPPMNMAIVSHFNKNNDSIEDAKTIRADYEVKFFLKPSQSAKSILNATKVDVQVSIDYESSLSGNVAANYNPRYQGHHFWAYDVKELLESNGMSSVQKGTDLVTIQYFTDAMVYVKDNDTGNTIVSVPADYV